MDSCCTYIPLQGILTSDWLFCQTEMLPDSKEVQTNIQVNQAWCRWRTSARELSSSNLMSRTPQTGNLSDLSTRNSPAPTTSCHCSFMAGAGFKRHKGRRCSPPDALSFASTESPIKSAERLAMSASSGGGGRINAAIIRDNQNIRCDYPFKRTGGLDDAAKFLLLPRERPPDSYNKIENCGWRAVLQVPKKSPT